MKKTIFIISAVDILTVILNTTKYIAIFTQVKNGSILDQKTP